MSFSAALQVSQLPLIKVPETPVAITITTESLFD